jgi:hypothetical protein
MEKQSSPVEASQLPPGGKEQAMESAPPQPWRLICDPKNWRHPVPIEEKDLSLLTAISERLGLVMTRDDERKKVYLGNALAGEPELPNGLRYPSGWAADVVPLEAAGNEYKPVDPLAAAPLTRTITSGSIRPWCKLSRTLELVPDIPFT